MNMFEPRRLSRVSIYAIVLLPFCAAAGYGSLKIERILNEAASARRRAVATLAAAVLDEKFGRLEDIGSSLATRVRFAELVERGRWREAGDIMEAVPKTFPFIDRVFLTDAGGTLRAHVPELPGVIGKNVALRDWYLEVLTSGRPSISEVYRRLARPQYDAIALAVPVRGETGVMTGVLVLQIRAGSYLDWIGAIPQEPGGNLEIFDQKGHLAASQRRPGEDGPALDERENAAVESLPKYGWSVVARQSGALSAGDRTLRILFAAYGVLFLGTLFLARVLVKALDALKANEGELARARDAALEAARFKSEFVANVSHEIRTQMNAIIGINELLMESPLTAAQREDLQTVSAASGVLLALTNDILDLSKLEAGKMVLEAIDFDLRRTLEDTVALLEGSARSKGLRIACSVSGDAPPSVSGDPRRLKQVLTNLLSNAVKFTDRGEVLLRAEKERETATAVWIRFEVRDTGIGISPEQRARLFKAFAQADSAPSRNDGGTGLGLFISKMIVEAMGGEIGVDSVADRGSTFWLRLGFPKSAETTADGS